jgi:hypothetical protein
MTWQWQAIEEIEAGVVKAKKICGTAALGGSRDARGAQRISANKRCICLAPACEK